MDRQNPNYKGNVAEAAIVAHATRLGIDVLRPQVEHCRYDLAFDLGPRIIRVQCKWAPRHGDVIAVNLTSSRRSSAGREIRRTYSRAEIDAIVAYCDDLDACYLVPIELAAGRRAIQLRLCPPGNGQRASINWAQDHELQGAVAQLEVASRWQREGRGFESHQLHLPAGNAQTTVGAHEFRNRFGWYMQRAAAGESFNVTRRGKPFVQLFPAHEAADQPCRSARSEPAFVD